MTLDSEGWVTIGPDPRPGGKLPSVINVMDAVSLVTVPDSCPELPQGRSNHPETHSMLFTDKIIRKQSFSSTLLDINWLVIEQFRLSGVDSNVQWLIQKSFSSGHHLDV